MTTTTTPAQTDRWWVPVAAAGAPEVGACLGVQRFDDLLVLWRDGESLSAFTDRCPHRGARLSLGRVRGGTLECPYHGWRFDSGGACVGVPAAPGFVPPAGHGATPWRLRQAHGLVFVAGRGATDDEPFAPPALDGWPRKRVLCGPFDVAASAPRVVENFLDTAHFGLVHEGWLGDREHLEVPDYAVEADALGRPGVPRYRAWQPRASSAASGGAWVEYRYQVLSPLAALLRKHSADGGTDEGYVLWTAPVGREGCRVWFTIATADEHADDELLRAFQRRIFEQDRPVVESQRPRELPLAGGEVHSAADRLSAAYRRWLRDIGYGYGCC
jgi:phenylpropionate dioxygenase-like ring-hydroxylating dioxygenase large terminal subunit